ncbi:TRAP transporter small permease subunit [Chloroflexota bacterium]
MRVRIRKYAETSQVSLRKMVEPIVIVISVAIIAIMGITCVDVFMRYVFSEPVRGATEMAEMFLPYVIFCSMAYALIHRRHVRVSLVADRLPRKVRNNLEYPVLAIELLFVGWLASSSSKFFWVSFLQREVMQSVIDLPWWVGKLAMTLGFILFTLGLISITIFKIARNNMVVLKSESGADSEW